MESLAHFDAIFACVCLAFREARTAAHNQVRAVVLAISLKDALSEDWEVFEEHPWLQQA
jgi:hypothetical protein